MSIVIGTPVESAGGDATSRTVAFTVGAGSKKVLVVVVSLDGNSGVPSVTNLTFAGIAGFKRAVRGVAGSGGNKNSEIWYFPDPPEVTGNIVATYSESNYNSIGAVLLTGVNLLNPIDTTGRQGKATDNISTDIVTNYNNSLIIDVCSKDGLGAAQGSQVERWGISYIFNEMEGSSLATTTKGSYTMAWVGGTGDTMQTIVAFREDPGIAQRFFANRMRPRIFAPGNAR